jgi:hypothetical protein
MSSRSSEKTGAEGDEIEVRFSIRQMMIAIALIGVALGLVIQVPFLVVVGLDAILLIFAFYKVVRLPLPMRIALLLVIAFVMLGICVGLLAMSE